MEYIQNSSRLFRQTFRLHVVYVFSEKEIGEHHMRLRLIDMDGKEIIQPIQGNMNIPKPQNGQYSAINLVFNFAQMKFEKAGRYSFEFYMDDDWTSGLPLFINQVS